MKGLACCVCVSVFPIGPLLLCRCTLLCQAVHFLRAFVGFKHMTRFHLCRRPYRALSGSQYLQGFRETVVCAYCAVVMPCCGSSAAEAHCRRTPHRCDQGPASCTPPRARLMGRSMLLGHLPTQLGPRVPESVHPPVYTGTLLLQHAFPVPICTLPCSVSTCTLHTWALQVASSRPRWIPCDGLLGYGHV